MATTLDRNAFYRTVWRWHFYAGLFVIPFVLLLAVTGSFYLFKPQVERWEERDFRGLSSAGAVAPHVQAEAALAAFPGARLNSYRLPERSGDAAMVRLSAPGQGAREVYVSPQGKVLGALDPKTRVMEFDKRIHGELLIGKRGSLLVELAASWAMVLILSGLYLWWPRGRGLAGVVWPRLRGAGGGRVFWRDLHAVTGFWISAFVLVLLSSGLPWATFWGSAFKTVRTEMDWMQGPQDWTIGGESPVDEAHAGHDGAAHGDPMADMPGMAEMPGMTGMAGMEMPMPPAVLVPAGFDEMVGRAAAETLAYPVIVSPPGAPGPFGRPGPNAWTIRSDAQNRPLQTTITYDAVTRREVARHRFEDGHPLDRLVGYGIAWHEGQLFGWINQLIGVLTAVGLLTVALSGFVMWRRRKPEAVLGAPPAAPVPARMGGAAVILLAMALVLPLLAASLVVLWVFDKLVLPRVPKFADWLGAPRAGPTQPA